MQYKAFRSNPSTLSVLLFALLTFTVSELHADTITVAVASNFAETLEDIVIEFEKSQSHTVKLVRGSSGRHYAQIVNGAPFDLFFSADSERPDLLVSDNVVPAENVKVYALGQLALWAPGLQTGDAARSALLNNDFNFLAIANPRLAPYGTAAIQTLDHLSLSDKIETGRVLTGENITQAFQYVATGNADLGFVALSQMLTKEGRSSGAYWLIPKDHYEPIYQKLAILKVTPASQAFTDWFFSLESSRIIAEQGYILPEGI